MSERSVLIALLNVFGHKKCCYYSDSGDHKFKMGDGATIYIPKRKRQLNGVVNYARFRKPSLEKFPNGSALRAYMEDKNLPDCWTNSVWVYEVGPEHIDAVIRILQGDARSMDQTCFPQEVAEALGCYVYRCQGPRRCRVNLRKLA